mmetsp:Transcript_86274/g.180519  ORF Transcript_86274/g.180519 Transcript_86274/m.180519 type:complete len:98 (-) Transcript_86274:407-700(-)
MARSAAGDGRGARRTSGDLDLRESNASASLSEGGAVGDFALGCIAGWAAVTAAFWTCCARCRSAAEETCSALITFEGTTFASALVLIGGPESLSGAV